MMNRLEKVAIIPNKILTIGLPTESCIPLIVKDDESHILQMTHVSYTSNKDKDSYYIRKNVINTCNNLINKYMVDTIIIEKHKLFTDQIGKYPDPLILTNLLLHYDIRVTIENTYFETVKYILEFSDEWKQYVLNNKVQYSIDLYKSHILNKCLFTKEERQLVDDNNYYRTLCLSESAEIPYMLKPKYWINYKNAKGDSDEKK